MASYIPIKQKNKILNNIFGFLSGGKRDITEREGYFSYVYFWNDIIVNSINIVFTLSFIFSAVAFFCTAWYGIYYDILKNLGTVTKIINGIELIFIAPLPLLITVAFHNYYKKIIIPIVRNKRYINGKVESYQDTPEEKDKISSLVDMGIIKYLFISIFISTIFVFMLGRMIKISGVENNRSYDSKIIISETQLNKGDSTVSVEFLTDTSAHTHIVSIAELSKISNRQREDLNENIKYDLFGLCVGIILIILLMIYIRTISKNLNEDIESSLQFYKESNINIDDIKKERDVLKDNI